MCNLQICTLVGYVSYIIKQENEKRKQESYGNIAPASVKKFVTASGETWTGRDKVKSAIAKYLATLMKPISEIKGFC